MEFASNNKIYIEEYIKILDAKLDEELAEYYKADNLDEFADLLEEIYETIESRCYHIQGRGYENV